MVVVVVQSFSHVQLFATPWTTAHQASLSFTISRNLLKLMSIESVMPSNHLILYRSLLLPSIFPSIRVFSNELALHTYGYPLTKIKVYNIWKPYGAPSSNANTCSPGRLRKSFVHTNLPFDSSFTVLSFQIF